MEHLDSQVIEDDSVDDDSLDDDSVDDSVDDASLTSQLTEKVNGKENKVTSL